jgi:hypothetical protein
MTVTYLSDLGQQYLDHIDYTGNGSLVPTNTVKFYLENRSHAFDMYVPNFSVKTRYRLKTVDVVANGNRVRTYRFSCGTSTNTARSVLTSLQQYGKDAALDASGTITGGSYLTPVTFTSQQGPNQFNAGYQAVANFGTSNGYTSFNAYLLWGSRAWPGISVGITPLHGALRFGQDQFLNTGNLRLIVREHGNASKNSPPIFLETPPCSAR